MRGYKALNEGLINRYGFVYEVGKTYRLNGNLKWRENGFHFCLRPEDTLRFVDGFNDSIVFVSVLGTGEIVLYEDDYYGYYDMYASSEMTILEIIKREDIFNEIINSNDIFRVKRFSSLIKLEEYEKEIILKKYKEAEFTINYYQNNEYILKRKLESN